MSDDGYTSFGDPSINQQTDQSINQSNNQSNNQSYNQSNNQSLNQSNNQSNNQSIKQSISQSADQPIKPSSNQSINSSVSMRSPMFNAIHLSVSMMFIFLAFSVAQNSQTSLSPSVGAIGLGILYGTFTLGNTVSSYIVQLLGLRISLFVGALFYCLYVAANIYTIDEVLYVVSGVIGLGAATIWTAQGSFISQCAAAHETLYGLEAHSMIGQFNGIFFSIFQVNQLVGNLLAALLYQFKVDKSTVFAVMTGLCALGVASLLLLPKSFGASKADVERDRLLAISDGDNRDDEIESVESTGFIAELKRALVSLTLLKDGRMLLLILIIMYSGVEQGWMYGTFPPLVKEANMKFYVLAALGAMDAASSYVMGKLSDRIGRIPILLTGALSHGALYGYFLIFVDRTQEYGEPYDIPTGYFFLMAFMLAIGDGAFNTQIYSILATYYKDRPAQAFANFKLFQAASTAGFFGFTAQPTKPTVFACSLIAIIVLGVGMLLLLAGRIMYPYSTADVDSVVSDHREDVDEPFLASDHVDDGYERETQDVSWKQRHHVTVAEGGYDGNSV